ncbi:hypothetical protein BP6252_06260 [Coleophoma cylindrospora]|uniref:Uncharacterized protein n=1 Tax=Coleophoma cylindrospora TaxID=1849047 RepID=A0A3D8RME9_9HELO|nr:hypothetical protein BP6252_06260 [Coleophoma cylindrospora]
MRDGKEDREATNRPGGEHHEQMDWDAPPPYEVYVESQGNNMSAQVMDDGRFSMQITGIEQGFTLPPIPAATPESLWKNRPQSAPRSYPELNIVIQVVGSRGDVQPFVALGQELKAAGHRVRLATHDMFASFILESGLEFFPIGGDPAELMAYMVKNPSILPTLETIRAGDIAKKRKMIAQMLDGFWKSCIANDPSTGVPFVAEAIIANPPSFAHFHCAQALAIPVHLMFTMPWSRTRAFPHPLANIQVTKADPSTTNFLSYGLVDTLTWQGLGDVVNHWRRHTLNLESVPPMVGPYLADALEIPFTYCWSPWLVPKPRDWPSYIDVCGFFFRNAPLYTPTPEIDRFLKSGSKPVYIGFGSIVMEEPEKMTQIIVEAIRTCGVRAIVSRGWSKLGSGISDEKILFIDDCPHEWLFKHVAAVVHHGGAGTTACGLANGCPTTIVPFFGDQPFWGNMVAAAAAGPRPIDHKLLSSDALAKAISFCLLPETLYAARKLSFGMKSDSGVKEAVQSFHRNLPINNMTCELLPKKAATWVWSKRKQTVKLSHRAAAALVECGHIDVKDLALIKTKPIYIDVRRWDPFTATTSAAVNSIGNMGSALSDVVQTPMREYRKAQTLSRSESGNSNTANAVGKATSASLGKFGSALIKTGIDLPLAFADGFRDVPRLYGQKVRDHGPISDWKTGGVVGGKALAYGMYDGYAGLFKDPYKGAKKEGAAGFAKGVATGVAGFMTKNANAIFGFVAYPALGLYRSFEGRESTEAQTMILMAQKEYGSYLAHTESVDKEEVAELVETFEDRRLFQI